MSQMMFIFTSTSNSIIFMVMKHPMSMGIMLLIQTVFICLITNNMSQTAWFSYILFLVFLGGMLVLFIYMTSVASNELFMKNKLSSFIILMVLISLTMMLFMLIDPLLLTNHSEDMTEMYKNMESDKLMISLFNYPNNLLTLFMVIYLFLTLIVVVKITESHQGPLRSSD